MEASRFKKGSSSQQGSLWIEAAFLTPVMILLAVGTAELGNFYLQRTSLSNAAHTIAMAVQQDPNMTAQRMYSFQKSLGSIGSVSFSERRYDGAALGNSCSVADCHIDGLEIHIASGASPLTAASVKGTVPSDWSDPRIGKLQGSNRWGVGSLQENPSWPKSASPFLADPNQDTSDDGRPYYVGVTTTWNYRSLTRFLGLDSKK